MKIIPFSLVLLIFTVSAAHSAETGTRHVESAGGYSYSPPKNWEMKEMPGLKFRVAIGPVSEAFAANITVVDEAATLELKDYVKGNVDVLTKVFQGFKNLGQSEFKTDSGLKGHKLITESDQQGNRLRQTFFFFDGKDGKKLVITCSAKATEGAKLDSTFDASLKTFALQK